MRGRDMHGQWIGGALIASLAITLAGTASAQQSQTPAAQPSVSDQGEPAGTPPPAKKGARHARVQAAPPAQTDPNLDEADQLAPSQMTQPMPAPVSEPTRGSTRGAPKPASHSVANAAGEAPPATAAEKPARMANTRTVQCSGAFAKDSSSLKLAMAFDSRNVGFTEVDASGSKVAASVLFPKDPKRRLEVWWSNPANRSQTYLILISGQSTWSGPGGMRLGLTLAQLEKLNHKPFKLKGFGKDNLATVSDWDGGALAFLAGGCKSGVSLGADSKAPAESVSALAPDHEYSSSDPAMRAVKPTVSEILIGY
jgi:hypothetical protein